MISAEGKTLRIELSAQHVCRSSFPEFNDEQHKKRVKTLIIKQIDYDAYDSIRSDSAIVTIAAKVQTLPKCLKPRVVRFDGMLRYSVNSFRSSNYA